MMSGELEHHQGVVFVVTQRKTAPELGPLDADPGPGDGCLSQWICVADDKLGSTSGCSVLTYPHPRRTEGDRQWLSACRQVLHRASRRQLQVEYRRGNTDVDSGGRKRFGAMPLQAFLSVEADCPVAPGAVDGDTYGEDSQRQGPQLGPEEEDQANPRHRNGEGQSDLQASSPGQANQPGQGVDAVVIGLVHGRRSRRSSIARTA